MALFQGLQQTEQRPKEHRHESHTGGDRQSTARVGAVPHFIAVIAGPQL